MFTLIASTLLATPPVFSELSYSEAKAGAMEADRLFLVDATAEWCGPCKAMDRDTWVDEDVVAWLNANAVAAQIDVDLEPELARELGIQAMPTVIAFRGDTIVDRAVGYQSPDQLLEWLGEVKQGRSRLDGMIEEFEAMQAKGVVNVQAQLDLASELVHAGRGAEAVPHYVWLWDNMIEHSPSHAGVRSSFMASDMKQLVYRQRVGKPEFTALRDQTEARLRAGEPTWADLSDWLVLNDVIGDADAILAWVDRNMSDEDGRASIQRFMTRVQPLLIDRGRWADVGILLYDPVAQIELQVDRSMAAINTSIAMGLLDEDGVEEQRQFAAGIVRDRAAVMHAALLAAGRDEDAWRVADVAFGYDDSQETRDELVIKALKADAPRERHVDLLAEDSLLRAKLDEALGG